MRAPSNTDASNTLGIITPTRELRCGGQRDNGSRCQHYFGSSAGRLSGIVHPCPRCKALNLFHEENQDADLLRERLQLAMAQEHTEQTLAEAMRRMVDTFADFIDTRRQRLVTI